AGHVVIRREPVRQADRERLTRIHGPAGPHEILRSRRPDRPGEPVRAAQIRDQAVPDLEHREARVRRDDPKVARERQLESRAGRASAMRAMPSAASYLMVASMPRTYTIDR